MSKKKKKINNNTESLANSKPVSQNKTGLLKILSTGITPYILLIIIGAGIYFQSLNYTLTDMDDSIIISNIKIGLQTNNLMSAFKYSAFMTDIGYFYRPLQLLSLMIDTNVSGSGYFIYHLSNLIIHLVTCCLIFYLLTLLKIDKIKGLIFTLIFLVHPLFNQAVIWIPARGDLLVTMFGLMSFIFLILFYKTNNLIYLIANILTFFASVFSKEIAILFPVIFILYYLLTFSDKKWNWKGILSTKNLIAISSWLIIIVIYFVLRMPVVKYSLPPDQAGIEPLIHNLPVFAEFISKFILPFNLSVLPQFNILSSILGITIILLFAFIFFKYRNKFGNYSILYIAWFFIFTFTPLLYRHFLLNNAYDYLEHRSYLPMIGILFLIASVDNNLKQIKYAYIIGLIFFLIFTGITLSREPIFKNSESFYMSEIDKGTGVALAYYNYGLSLSNKNENNKSIFYYNKALDLKNDYTEAFIGRAMSYSQIGNKQQAIQDFYKILKLEQRKDMLFFIRGKLNSDLGKLPEAIEQYSHAIELNKTKYDFYNNRANTYFRLKNFQAAIDDFKKVLRLKPDYDYAFNALGTIYGNLQNHQEALLWFQRAVNSNQKNTEALINLGFAKQNTNDLKGACDCWHNAYSFGNIKAKNILDKYCK